jgi:hypothetical protein
MTNDPKRNLNIYYDLCPCNSGKKIIDCCFAEINTTPPGQKTGYAHPNCYARSLQDCSRTISKEHYISRGILELFESKTMSISGVSWLKPTESQTLPKDALAAKVLCQRHNEALSGLDSIAQKYFRFILGKNKNQWAMIIRGYEIERWMLKACCGVISSGTIENKSMPPSNSMPSVDLLNTLFYRKEIPLGHGLFLLHAKRIQSETGLIRWGPLLDEKYGLIGFLIKVELFEMGLSFGVVHDDDDETEKKKGLKFHPSSIAIDDKDGYREIHFGWPEGGHVTFTETNTPHELT